MNSTVRTVRARIDARVLESGVAIISASGIVDSTNFEEVDRLLQGLYRDGCTRMIVDMANLKFISSSGLGTFLGYVSSTAEKGGGVIFANVGPDVMNVFEVTGLAKILRVATSLDDAVAQFEGVPPIRSDASLFFL